MKQKSKHAKRQSSKSKPINDDAEQDRLRDHMALLRQVLQYRQFLGSGFDPIIRDAEIIVCFADVRGFTDYCRRLQREMQDRKIQNFLRTYVRIFAEGLMRWQVTSSQRLDKDVGASAKEIARHVVPSMYKNLGDGMMLTWEIPDGMELNLQGRLTQEILFLIDNFSDQFQVHFRDLTPTEQDSFSAEVERLQIGFGVAKGHAWRLDFGHSIDYAGSVINLASRLESLARPKGIICLYDVSPWLFDEMHSDDDSGVTGTISGIKGYDPVRVWLSRLVDPKGVKGFKPDARRTPNKALQAIGSPGSPQPEG